MLYPLITVFTLERIIASFIQELPVLITSELIMQREILRNALPSDLEFIFQDQKCSKAKHSLGNNVKKWSID